MSVKAVTVPVKRCSKDGQCIELHDDVVRESWLTIYVNNRRAASLACTPDDLDYLAVGYLLSTGIVQSLKEIRSWTFNRDKTVVHVSIGTSKIFEATPNVIPSGCGGNTSQQPVRVLPPDMGPRITCNQLLALVEVFQKQSRLFRDTGGVHSAALCTEHGAVIHKEDIGRHNAVDKVIGEAVLKENTLHDKILITSGRISSDLASKAAHCGIPFVVSRSAPTCMALTIGEETGLTIVSFARANRLNVYTGHWRVG
ncbi:MAG: formate dehydrogenase accessory sulfurtransferase FdhD [Peptococcaceae bacterium]|nr:formate dehydrogenase accessory sulfurtransferase FdhD [Peptococcaceae bacterium]